MPGSWPQKRREGQICTVICKREEEERKLEKCQKSMRTQCGFLTSHKLNINNSLQLNLKLSRQIPLKGYNMK